ncbi:MAG: hypothetical protein ACQERF_08975, partial [Actinomycetota bacterium]
MSDPQDGSRPGRDPDEFTPSVPWDDSGVAPAEAAPGGGDVTSADAAPVPGVGDVTSIVPTGHDGETRVIPSGSPWRQPSQGAPRQQPDVAPPQQPDVAPPQQPDGAPWNAGEVPGGPTVAPPSGNPWANQPTGLPPGQIPPGASLPPGGPPYAAVPGAPAPQQRSRAALWIVLASVVVLAVVGVVVATLVSQ